MTEPDTPAPSAAAAAETLEHALTRAACALAESESLLASWPAPELRREAEALVLTALQLTRSALYQNPDRRLTPDESQRLSTWLMQRRCGVPLAYLSGQREFWSLSLIVTPDVLVPRPETEHLVEQALLRGRELQSTLERPLRVLELGTGSGAIILALCHEEPSWHYTATDVSDAALAVAQRNAHAQGRRFDQIRFIQGDWFTAVADEIFDLIVSNPPYVAADDPCLANDSLCHEPLLALTPGDDALTDICEIITASRAHLSPGGWLLLEHGAHQADAVRAELRRNGYTAHSLVDLAGHWRISEGCLNL